MDTKTIDELKTLLGESLQLGDRTQTFDESTPLFGSLPELDSMAVVTVIMAIEDRFDFEVEDEEISAEVFETLGSLTSFIDGKLSQ